MKRLSSFLLPPSSLLELLLFSLMMALPLSALAEERNGGAVGRFARKVGNFIDTMTVRGIDQRYIEMPAKPWQVLLQGNVNQSRLTMNAQIDGKVLFDDDWGIINWKSRIKTDLTTYAGFWAGYRGYGLGYTRNVGGGEKGSLFKLGAVGSSYGVNFRIHKFETDEPEVKISGYMPEWYEETLSFPLESPIRVRLTTLDAYYIFNSKRFSHTAAYDQSVIQRRSAGSLMAGALYYNSSMSYADGPNADFIMFMNDIGKMKQYQLSLGAGYAYNLVPCRGLLVSGMAMLMFTAYNRLDVWRYNSLLREAMLEERTNPTPDDEIDSEPIDDDEFEDLIPLILGVWPMEQNHHIVKHSRVIPVVDARLSITYNVGDLFFNVNTQLNNFRFKHDSNKGILTDWYVNASVGIRL